MTQKGSTIARAALFIIILVALYDVWTSLKAIRFIIARGSPLSDALFEPPTSIVRLVACTFIVLGAALMIAAKRIGMWLIIPGTLLYAVLVIALATQSYGASIWLIEAFRLSIFVAMLALIAAIRAFRRKSSSASH